MKSMKFLYFSACLLISQLLVGQGLLERQITPSIHQGTIKEIIEGLEVDFIYDSEKVDVSIYAELLEKDYTVRSLLEQLFNEQDIQFIIRGDKIILKRKLKDQKGRKGKATIYGYIIDESSGESLLGASILDARTGLGTIANYYGYYSLTIPIGEVKLEVSFTGMEKQTRHFSLKGDSSINVNMLPEEMELDEVVITGEEFDPIQESTEMGTATLNRQQIQSRPAIGGEVDVIKVLQLLPGVQSGIEGSSSLYVRGGGPDQNLILLDGVPVYNTSHLFGFSSVFNSDAINSVKLIKSAFPARYGGRLSSVVDMSMKEGNLNEMKGVANISVLASSLMLEGPIAKKKSSFMIAGRRSFIDLLTKSKSDNNYYFYDFNLKMNHRFSEKDRIFFSTYLGKDSGELNKSQTWTEETGDAMLVSRTETKSNVEWGSSISVLRWNHVFNPKLFSNLNLSYSTYDFEAFNDFYSETRSNTDTLTEYQRFITSSDISDLSIRLDVDFYPHPNHSLKIGAQNVVHQFKPNVVGIIASEQPDATFNALNSNANEYVVFAEDEISFSRKLKANVGIHLSGLEVTDTFYSSLQPRVSLRWLLNEKLALKSSYAEMTQFLHLLTNPGLGLPTDLWVPVTERVPPQESTQYTLGLAHTLTSGLEITLEGYFKKMSGLIEYKDGANFLRLNEDWQDKINIGNGTSYGMELFVNHKGKRFEGWVGYTLAWSNRIFDQINFGKQFPYKYDRRHDIKTVLSYRVKRNVILSANWVYGTGIALTLPSSKYSAPTGVIGDEHETSPTPILNFESRNGYRQRPSHRLDLNASFSKKKKRTERTWILTVYNLYNRRNPVFIEVRPTQDFDGLDWNLRFKEYSFLSIIPSISYRLSF